MMENRKKYEVTIYDNCISDDKAFEKIAETLNHKSTVLRCIGGENHGINIIVERPSSRKAIVTKVQVFKDEDSYN